MSANLEALDKEAQVLRAAVDGKQVNEAPRSSDSSRCMALTTLPALPPCGIESPTAKQELQLARHVLESATLLSILREDMTAFERSMIQLKIYYNCGLEPSPLHYPILGTRLLQLLVENRMAEFHNELELLPEQSRQDPNIAFAVKLEQYLMEGTYNKVLESRTNVPNPYFPFFLSQLLQTVRENIADCAEHVIQEEKTEWVVREGRVWFKAPEKSLGASDIPSLRLVGETLAYATELDRIV
ncbi:26S proteasome non-ATPase regulatory subunit Rpn12 [Phytophthora cactorum]|nr:26S proteasome non-ATPase regulatory subunit Rpn12 [Phytophthora cactorum]